MSEKKYENQIDLSYEPDENQLTIFDVLDENDKSDTQAAEEALNSRLENSIDIEETIRKVAEMAVASAPKIINKKKNKKTGSKKRSSKPIKVEIKEGCPPFKAAIIEKINEGDYTYGDLIDFFTKRHNGDANAGSKEAYNYIRSLHEGEDLMSFKVSEFLEFLNLTAVLVSKDKVKTEIANQSEIARQDDDNDDE